MEKDDILQIVIAIIGSGAFFSLIQFLITFIFSRKDEMKMLKSMILELKDDREEDKAILARTHILRFADDIRNGIHHSDEYFLQQLADIDEYNEYCRSHPKFSNGRTIIASQIIEAEYRKKMEKGDNQNEIT